MHVAVTGASSGIGEALVREFARAGAAVTLVARRKELLDAIAAEVDTPSFVMAADLCDVERAGDWIEPAEAALGPIDVLVNNAGVQVVAPASGFPVARGEDLLRVNVLAPLRITATILPRMLARRSGTIVDVASVAGIVPLPGMYYYNASKAALANASEGLRAELRGTGVHVVTVYPGPVETAMARMAYGALPDTWSVRNTPRGTTEELARLVRRAVERKRDRVVYPAFYELSRWFPGLARWSTALLTPRLKAR